MKLTELKNKIFYGCEFNLRYPNDVFNLRTVEAPDPLNALFKYAKRGYGQQKNKLKKISSNTWGFKENDNTVYIITTNENISSKKLIPLIKVKFNLTIVDELNKSIQESVKPFQTTPIEVKIQKDDMSRWNAVLQTVDGPAGALFPVGYETQEQAEHAAMMKGYTFDGNSYNSSRVSERRQLKSMIKRIIREEMQLNEYEVTDEKAIAAIEELERLTKLNDEMERKIKAIEDEYNSKKLNARIKQILNEEIYDILEECKKMDDRFIRAKKIIMKIQTFQSEKITYKYEEFYKYIMQKISMALQGVALDFLKTTQSISKQKAKVSFTKNEAVLNEGWLDSIKAFFSSIKKNFSSLKVKGKIIDALLDKAESVLNKISK